ERAPVAKTAPAAARIIAGVREQARTGLLETEAREMLACYAIGVPPTLLARSEEDAEAVIAALGDGPLALKVVSRDILHKSDAGGVRLNVAGVEAVRHAISDITESVRRHDPDADVAGVLA